jgi:hypothetical protein
MADLAIPEADIFPRVRVLASDPARVAEIPYYAYRGPWPSKSGGDLWLVAQFGLDFIQNFFNYDPHELERFAVDIRGYRQYIVTAIPDGSLGGKHFHRVRQSIVQVLSGRIDFHFEDAYGDRRSVVLEPNGWLLMPPFIYVTYEAQLPDSSFSMIVNTKYTSGCHDECGEQELRELQARFKE